jgi:integrase/recombinase XerD
MTPLRKRTIEYMTLKGYSASTQRSYLQHIGAFALHFNCCPSQLDCSHVQQYLHHLVSKMGLSRSSVNTAYSGIKLLFVNVLEKPWNAVVLPRPKRIKTLPVVLSRDEVQRIFNGVINSKHRALLMLIYSSGLRVGEATRLQVPDIDSQRMTVRIRQGKGRKDRYSILSALTLRQLRSYWQVYRPRLWLFEGHNSTSHLSIRTVQTVYAQAKRRAGVHKRGGVHQLRHCFATHLIEHGVDVSKVQLLMGHTHLGTTARYLHLSTTHLAGIEHPMDKSTSRK